MTTLNQARGRTNLTGQLGSAQAQSFQAKQLRQPDTSNLTNLAGNVTQGSTALLTDSIRQAGGAVVQGVTDFSLQRLENEQGENIEAFLESRKSPEVAREALANVAGLEQASEGLWAKLGEGADVDDINHISEAQDRELNKYQRAVQQGVMSREELEVRVLETTRQAIRRTPGLSDALMSHAEKVLAISGVRMTKDPEVPGDKLAEAHATIEKLAIKHKVAFDPRHPDHTEMISAVNRKLQQQNDFDALVRADESGQRLSSVEAQEFVEVGGMSAFVNGSLSNATSHLMDIFNDGKPYADQVLIAKQYVTNELTRLSGILRNQNILQTPQGQESLKTLTDGLTAMLETTQNHSNGSDAVEGVQNEQLKQEAIQKINLGKRFNLPALKLFGNIPGNVMKDVLEKGKGDEYYTMSNDLITIAVTPSMIDGFTEETLRTGTHDNTTVYIDALKFGDPEVITDMARGISEGLTTLNARNPRAVVEYLDNHLKHLGSSETKTALRDKDIPVEAIQSLTVSADEYMRQTLNLKRSLVNARERTLGAITGLSTPTPVKAEVLADGRIVYVSEDKDLQNKLNDQVGRRYNFAIRALANLSGSTQLETSRAFFGRNSDAFDIERSSFEKVFGKEGGSNQGKKIDRKRIEEVIDTESASVGIDPKVVRAMVGQESNFNQNARSEKDAFGLAQLTAATAKELGVDRNDPEQNLIGGIRYLKRQIDTFGSLELGLAAYNAGPGAVRDYINGTNKTGKNPKLRRTGGIPNFPETQNYVKKIMANVGMSDETFSNSTSSNAVTPAINPDTLLNFEQRILTPSKFPVINNPDGSVSTHRMASGEVDGKFIAFPTIIQDSKGSLQQLDMRSAFDHAVETKEYRSFSTEAEAQAYAEGGYKRSMGSGE